MERFEIVDGQYRHTYGYIPANLPPHDYGQRGNYQIPLKVTGPDGRQRCRWCLGKVEPPRRSWCSQACVDDAYARRSWPVIRDRIIERDGHRCVLCGGVSYLNDPWLAGNKYGLRVTEGFEHLPANEQPRACRLYEYFEVDHILEVVEGGTDDPANLRTLCRRCHREKTAAWHRGRAEDRNPQLRLLE